MQNNNNNNNQQVPQQPLMPPANGNAQTAQQYRAALQNQQMAAMARLHAQQGGANPGAQQQAPAQQQAGASVAGNGGNAATQAQVQLLQQLFHSNPEKLAEFVALSKEGKISPEHIAQLRGAVAAQQAQQQARTAGTGQPIRPAQQMQQQQAHARPPVQQAPAQAPPPTQQLQQQPSQQPVQVQTANRPPDASAQPTAQSGQGVPRDFSQIMVNIQKAAEPIVRRVKELEGVLAKPAESGGIAAGPDRAKVEAELGEMKKKQLTLGHQYLAAKAQLLQQQGKTEEAQQIMASLQQRAGAGGARPTPRPSGSNAQQGAATAASAAGQAQGSPAAAARPPSAVAPTAGATTAGSAPSPAGAQKASTAPTGVPAEAMVQRPSGNMSQMGTSVPATLNVTPSIPEPYPNSNGPRPTLSQGLGTNPLLGTPAILQRPEPLSGSAAGLAAGSTGGAAGQGNRWEDLIGVGPREGKAAGSDARLSTANADDLAAEAGRPEFWDSMTGNGTGAESLLNAGSSTTAPAAGGVAATAGGRLLSKHKVQELMGEIDPNERLEGAVEDLLLEIADEFIDSVTQFACRLAKHRKGDRLEARDVQLHLERSWNLRIPTPGSVPIPPPRIKTATQQGGAAGKSGGGANAASAT